MAPAIGSCALLTFGSRHSGDGNPSTAHLVAPNSVLLLTRAHICGYGLSRGHVQPGPVVAVAALAESEEVTFCSNNPPAFSGVMALAEPHLPKP